MVANEITIAGKIDHETSQAEFDIAGGVHVGKDDIDVARGTGICFHFDFDKVMMAVSLLCRLLHRVRWF